MRIRNLRAVGWRNLEPLELTFDASVRLNVLHGDNGQGKTNVIEALYYLAGFRSFRTTRAADLVQRGCDEARIGVDAETRELVRSVDVRLHFGPSGQEAIAGSPAEIADTGTAGSPAQRPVIRSIVLDSKPIRGVASAFGVISVVLFVPEDLLLVRAAPVARRRFLDMAISGVEPAYFGEAATFQKVLRSRNALLRAGRTGASPALLETYDEQLAVAGARLVLRRRALASALGADVQRLFSTLHADLPVVLRYESHATVQEATREGDIAAALLLGLTKRRVMDERRGHTTFGPQTDDLEIHLGGRPAREHASQGQLRSLVLAMKLAELGHIERHRGEAPALLLDDVPSELDPQRRLYLFETLGRLSCQTVVSVADPAAVPRVVGRADFRVASGRLASVPVP